MWFLKYHKSVTGIIHVLSPRVYSQFDMLSHATCQPKKILHCGVHQVQLELRALFQNISTDLILMRWSEAPPTSQQESLCMPPRKDSFLDSIIALSKAAVPAFFLLAFASVSGFVEINSPRQTKPPEEFSKQNNILNVCRQDWIDHSVHYYTTVSREKMRQSRSQLP